MPDQEETRGQNPERASTALSFLDIKAENSTVVPTTQRFLLSVCHETITQNRMREQEHGNTHFMAQTGEYHTSLQPPSQLMGPLV